MRQTITYFLLFAFLSCKQHNERTGQLDETPKALQENTENSLKSYAKRGPDDLVEQLYHEKLKEADGLTALEKKFDEINKNKVDSLDVFHEFDSKNKQYYRVANNHLNRIQDSLLKNELKILFENSQAVYSNSISKLQSLEEQLGKQFLAATDRRIALKLFVTLNMMNDFKKKNNPSATTLQSVINDYKRLNGMLDSAIVKNKY